jgi:hypothetical protein
MANEKTKASHPIDCFLKALSRSKPFVQPEERLMFINYIQYYRKAERQERTHITDPDDIHQDAILWSKIKVKPGYGRSGLFSRYSAHFRDGPKKTNPTAMNCGA